MQRRSRLAIIAWASCIVLVVLRAFATLRLTTYLPTSHLDGTAAAADANVKIPTIQSSSVPVERVENKGTTTVELNSIEQQKQPIAEEIFHQENQKQQPKPQPKKPIAIFHVGPGKTGTSSIQKIYRAMQPIFESDNFYWVPIKAMRIKFAMKNQNDTQSSQEALDATNFVETMQLHAAQGHNVFVSNEHLGSVPFANRHAWKLLKQALEPFNATVVVGYRRFFEWWLSSYQYNAKGRAKRQRGLDSFANTLAKDLIQTYNRSLSEDPEVPFGGPPPSYIHPTQRVADRFREMGLAQTSIFNMHDQEAQGGLVPGFYCRYFGASSQTCRTLLQKGDTLANSSPNDYEDA